MGGHKSRVLQAPVTDLDKWEHCMRKGVCAK